MHNAPSFTADLPPIPARLSAQVEAGEADAATIRLLRAVVDAQRDALDLVLKHGNLSPTLRNAVAEALLAAELAR